MRFVLTPDWFLGKDVLIESFSFLVLLVFVILCIRNYKLNKNKKIMYLGIGFGLIALAQLATVATKFVLYYDFSFTQSVGRAIIEYEVVKSVDIFYKLGFFFHRLLTLVGLYVIYRLPIKRKSPGDFLLALYFIVISAMFSSQLNYLFHSTALILLVLITNNYYTIYKKNRFSNTKILVAVFGMLGLSQLMFVLSTLETVYVAANIIELLSYSLLLFLIVRILKHGKKKKPDGYNFRHAKYRPGKGR
jgi:hypothetical protein